MTAPPLVTAENLVRRYPLPRRTPWRASEAVVAVGGVSFAIGSGRSLGIVGESGSGKSTLARLVMALEPPDCGRVLLLGDDLNALKPAELRARRRDFQMVFQDPFGSLDPRQTVARIVGEPLDALSRQAEPRHDRIAEALASVGLKPGDGVKYPHEFSGGQRQRIAIARALITRPKLIVADEPVSALDVSVQAQVLNLLRELAARHGVTYLLISHDLAVVAYITARIAVMHCGVLIEIGPTADVLAAPRHPYTRALKEAVPRLEPGRRRALRRAPAAAEAGLRPAAGCAYAPRCPLAGDRCRSEGPELREVMPGRHVACHFA
jgi:peptide/nickel transport system ATP-binding protein